VAVIPYPFASGDSNGTVSYRDSQTIGYNEYWYEREPMKQGQTIDYRVEALSEVTFLIWDQPFENLPENQDLTGSYSESMIVQADHDYQYIGYFLKPGSELNYQFNVTGGEIDFFVADANALNRWNNWETIIPEDDYTGSESFTGSYTVEYAQDWYLVWYNPTGTPIQIDFQVDYLSVDNIDVSVGYEVIEDLVLPQSDTFEVPHDGTWYFFIYMNPFVNAKESVLITFDVQFNTEVTHEDQWKDVRPILFGIGFIVVLVLIVAVIQRRSSKKSASAAATTAGATSTPATTTSTTPSAPKTECHRCKAVYRPSDVFCTNCGAKLHGRDYGTPKTTTPANSKLCKNCNDTLKTDSRFCKNCGTPVEQKTDSRQFFSKERKSFFCQLDNEQHPSTDSAYQCDQCSRMVCDNCYEDIGKTGIRVCPYCKGNLSKVQ
jgi:predicted amidophosphoribosyltransferase